MKSFSFVCQKYLYCTSIFKGYFKILILLFLIRKQISFLLLFSCIKCCLFLWLLSRFSIYLGLQTLTMISLCVLCVFLLFEVCWASWIYGLVSLINFQKKFGHYLFKYFLMLHSLYPFSQDSNYICTRPFDIALQVSDVLFWFISSFFFFVVSLLWFV